MLGIDKIRRIRIIYSEESIGVHVYLEDNYPRYNHLSFATYKLTSDNDEELQETTKQELDTRVRTIANEMLELPDRKLRIESFGYSVDALM